MQSSTIVHVIDGNAQRRAELASLVYGLGWHAEISASIGEFTSYSPIAGTVLLHDDPDQHLVAAFFEDGLHRETWFPVIAYACAIEPRQIVDAIREGGSDYLAYPFTARDLLESLARLDKTEAARRAIFLRKAAAQKRIDSLSKREGQVLRHMISGKSNRLIAQELGIGSRTVEVHRSNLIAKLGAQNTAEAIRLGVEAYRSGASIRE
jgi:FixJ family two-component response regulator